MENLALLGGKPVRNKPFAPNAVLDAEERKEVLGVLKRRELSRFMGSPTADIQKVLRLKSSEAPNYNPQYFTYLGGRKIREFERDFAAYFKADYAVSVNSATSGLSTAVAALGLEPGDEILTTAMSFHATAASIVAVGIVPVFCDVSRENFCMDPAGLEAKLTPRTKAVMVVHLLGFPADMDAILAFARRHKLKVIEDCAQAPGTRFWGRYAGTMGDIGVFSLQETKNITTGEGGMILTKDPELAARCRLIRNHGESVPDETWTDRGLVNIVGFNFRMTELTAAVGVAQLKKLDKNNAWRNRNARYLAKNLQGLRGLAVPKEVPGTIYHIFPLFYDERATGVPRDKIVHALRAEGIPVGTGYLKPMYEHPLFLKRIAFGSQGFPFTTRGANGQSIHYRRGDCPVTEDLLRRQFIWFYQFHRPTTLVDMDTVVRAFRKIWASLDALKEWDPAGRKLAYKW